MPYECNRVDDAIGQSRHSFRSFFKSSSKPLMSILPFRSPRRLERACLMRIPSPAWDRFLELKVPELHDRMIAALALHASLPLVTSDPSFDSVVGLNAVWK